MSKYTTELRFICEVEAGRNKSGDYGDVASVISTARPKIFSFSYPIFDANYKPTLETKIIKHFYTREIGYETYGLWKLKLETKMNEIMSYYNKLYESELIEFNPLYDTDLHTEGVRHDTLNTTESGNTSGHSTDGGSDTRTYNDKKNTWDLYSDTPQGGINGIAATEDDPALGTNAFLSNARHTFGDTAGSTGTTSYGKTNNSSGSSSSTGNSIGNGDYAEHVYGYRGKSPSKSIKEFREIMLNIDMMVIEELEELFFQLW